MDNLLQLQIVADDERGLKVPTRIERLIVDPKKHKDCVRNTCRLKNVYENTVDVVQIQFKGVSHSGKQFLNDKYLYHCII